MSLTERQQKWFASIQASTERETGKTIDEWIAIARTCPETKPRARQAWLKEHHGLGVNRASYVLSLAFPSEERWDQPDVLRAKLWSDPAAIKILEAVEAAAIALPDVVVGQRKGFTAFSRKVQFAALRPLKDGQVALGLAIVPTLELGLQAPRNEPWSERLTARLPLPAPAEVDERITALLAAAWARS
ncbi:MAG: DUF4287 domain-containing protein [Pseudomonadota bacterium]|uniref:DUF4287 domain-containing protein n=1 Tax=Phenylobacterium sp. TaxID=1871053 RepID=UPI0025D5FD0B|nr:DUF4287 domain-containing protein [Phenylobacterium sp.]MBT9472235.1 DUF4287 domain-containing protein [Phenylobacterium sp.]